MKKYDIIYTALIDALDHISVSQDAEDYEAKAIAAAKEDEYARLVDSLQDAVLKLKEAQSKKEISASFPEIYDLVNLFGLTFPDFPNLNLEKLRLQILFRRKIAEGESVLGTGSINEDDIDHEVYVVNRLDELIDQKFFETFNPSDASNSAVFFSLVDYGKLEKELEASSLNLAFLYSFLHPLDVADITANNQYVITKKPAPPDDLPVIKAFVKLLMVGKGLGYRNIPTRKMLPQVLNYEQIVLNIDYRQHNDIINTLNEYNNRHELITKYLTIYQIVENFMYKRAIVYLESRAGGKVFSIRDFSRLYGQVKLKEIEVLIALFKETFKDSVSPSATFKSWAQTQWNNIVSRIPEAEVNDILLQMGMSKKGGIVLTHADIVSRANEFELDMSNLVYSMRNSIVHNKETEFHLTTFTITKSIEDFLEFFLLPLLEGLVFHLISTRNNYVWYTNQSLQLFE